jgi:predicted metal-dependent phosphoesterase TrpH
MTVGASGLRLDLHNHTAFSPDGLMSPAVLLAAARARGLSCIAITDHNTIRGAIQGAALAESDPTLPRVIPGMELSTRDGEVIGLYLSEEIPARLTAVEAIVRIKAQGGLVCLPHPFDVSRRGTISRRALVGAAELADIIEVVNGRSLGPWGAGKAQALARRLGKPGGAGSDAHRTAEVGSAYLVVDALPTRDTLLSLVESGFVEHDLTLRKYTLNWAFLGLSPVTRVWRRLTGTLS